MRDAGFIDVVEKHFYWPPNIWPRDKKNKLIGVWAPQNMLDGIEGMSMALLTRGLKWSQAQVEVLLMGVRNDLKNCAVHAYVDVSAYNPYEALLIVNVAWYSTAVSPGHLTPLDLVKEGNISLMNYCRPCHFYPVDLSFTIDRGWCICGHLSLLCRRNNNCHGPYHSGH
jgi:hypothetical protein